MIAEIENISFTRHKKARNYLNATYELLKEVKL
jgi:hypothetical protein